MSALTRDGARIDYLEGGSGAPLLLVHGSWGDRLIWDLVRPGFERSFRTLADSRRGHGKSTGDGSLDEDVRDLAALIEQLDAAPAHLAGNSLGATICLRLLASRPDLVASLSAHELATVRAPGRRSSSTKRSAASGVRSRAISSSTAPTRR